MNPTQSSTPTGSSHDRVSHRGHPALGGSSFVGCELFSGDKCLGAIEELIVLNGEPYCLVDTRHWTFGERRLVPAAAICHQSARATATTTLDVKVIRRAPDFNPFRLHDSRYTTGIQDHYHEPPPPPEAEALIGDHRHPVEPWSGS